MNKLVIIGNGFDLAHELKTSYKDFLLWHIDKVFKQNQKVNGLRESNLISLKANIPYSKLDFDSYTRNKNFDKNNYATFKINSKNTFIKRIFNEFETQNWVDVEQLYYDELVKIHLSDNLAELKPLNEALKLIKKELQEYLTNEINPDPNLIQDIINIFYFEILHPIQDEVYVLNFNYTSTIEKYLPKLIETFGESTIKHINSVQNTENQIVYLNYIHGKLDNEDSMIFGYGDETDKHYAEIEDQKNNDFLMHMKSFAYLQRKNYKHLFEFLDKENSKFEVHIMGHSCGLSDRLLFTHILEHPNLSSVKIYYYEYEVENEKIVNDHFQKTQELSRYFRKDDKHKMRRIVVPFSESVPLVKIKQKTD